MNLKNFLTKNLGYFTTIASIASIAGFINQIGDDKLKLNYLKLQKDNETLREQINEIKIDEIKNELTKNKVETLR